MIDQRELRTADALSAEQPVVVGVSSNPEPHEVVASFDGECAIVTSGANRPEPANLLQLERRMAKVLVEVCVRLVRKLLDILWQRLVARPEVGRRVVSQRRVVLPAW